MIDRKIVVVGDVMLDKYTRVRTTGVSKENTAVVVAREEAVDYGLGGAANVARGVQALGGRVTLLGFNSDRRVTHLVDAAKLHYLFDHPPSGQTPVKNRIVTRDGHYMLRLDEESGFFGRPPDWWRAGGGHLGDAFKNLVFPANRNEPKPVVCLVDYDKGCLTTPAAGCFLFHVNQVTEHVTFPVIVDPGRHGFWDKFSSPRTVFRANLYQAVQHYARNSHNVGSLSPVPDDFDPGELHPQQVYEMAAHAVCNNLRRAATQFAFLVLTLGPGGLIVADREADKLFYKPAPQVAVADTCGAGDAVTAAMAVILAGEEFPLTWDAMTAAVQAAGNAAAIAVRKPGVYAVTREDMGWYARTE